MIETTFASQTVFLLWQPMDWGDGFRAQGTFLTDTERGKSGRSARTPLREVMLIEEVTFSLFLVGDEFAEIAAALQSRKVTPVLCPFWPAAANFFSGNVVYASADGSIYEGTDVPLYEPAAGPGPIEGGLRLTFEPDWSEWEIHTGPGPESFDPSNEAVRVPLLWGQFAADPQPKAVKHDLARMAVTFREDGPVEYALRWQAQTYTPGPSVVDQTPSVFPIMADWGRAPEVGGATVSVERRAIGFRRDQAQTYYPQNSERPARYGFSLFGWDEIVRLVRFFIDHRGDVGAFWLPRAISFSRLAADVAAGASSITVDRTDRLGLDRYLALMSDDGVEVRRIDAPAEDATVIALAEGEAVLSAWQRAFTVVTTAMLARFETPALGLSWTKPTMCQAVIEFREVSGEYLEAVGETIGTTQGRLKARVFWYDLWQDFGDAERHWRYTNHEAAVSVAGESWEPYFLRHRAVDDVINLDDASTEIEAQIEAGSPFALYSPYRIERPLQVKIWQGEIGAAGAVEGARCVFTGRATRPRLRGDMCTLQVESWGRILDRMFPSFVIQRSCNYHLFQGWDAPANKRSCCRLNPADWEFAGEVVSYTVTGGDVALVIDTVSRVVGTKPTLAEHYFWGGRVEIGSGTAREYRSLLDSSAESGGALTLTLSLPLESAPAVGSVVRMWPGCDGRASTCKAKFANYLNFGGVPHIPDGNPTLAPVGQHTGGYGKK